MEVVLQYFDGCPNWVEADKLLREALAQVGSSGIIVKHQKVETFDQAVAAGFIGSPTILIDGRDPFAVVGAQAGMACRVYSTPEGLSGSPTLEQLVAVLLR
ncbi:MAG: thioredoxin family protein [Actinomycetota bacterium]|nr:thioredoxin family protein [Actinomycetota bacterium]